MVERNDLTSDQWDGWIVEVCSKLGVDASLVNVPLIHDLTKQVAHRFDRPMAPVSAHLIGIALGHALATNPTQDPAVLLDAFVALVESTLPPAS